MKKLGKAILGLVAAVAMLVTGLVAPLTAVAADGDATIAPATTITIKDVYTGDKYEGWRLLNVTQTQDGKNTSYQLNDKYTEILKEVINAAKANTVTATSGEQLRSQIVGYLAGIKDDSAVVRAFANAVWDKLWDKTNNQANANLGSDVSATADNDGDLIITNAQAGYYLIAQTANGKTGEGSEDGKAYSLVMLDTKGLANVDVTPKKKVPTFEKKVLDTNDSTDEKKTSVTENDAWSDSADHDVNDPVFFQFKSTMPQDIAEYETYKYVFHDSMSKGLTFNKDSVKVYLNNVADANKIDVSSYVVASSKDAGFSDNNPAVENNTEGTNFTISFNDLKAATINGTKITLDENSVIYVEYTGTLNDSAVIGAAGNPNQAYLEYENNPNDEGKGTSRTKNDKVVVFTYQVDINKTDSTTHAGSDKLAGAVFQLFKKYKTAPVNGTSYPTAHPEDTVNATTYASYYQVGNDITVSCTTTDGKTTCTSSFERVDDGDYILVEKTAPDGYNKLAAPEAFTITATHDLNSDDLKLTAITLTNNKFAANEDTSKNPTGIITGTIENVPGSLLPSTGGMGTVILYALGGAFVVAAGLWFGLRRRFSNR